MSNPISTRQLGIDITRRRNRPNISIDITNKVTNDIYKEKQKNLARHEANNFIKESLISEAGNAANSKNFIRKNINNKKLTIKQNSLNYFLQEALYILFKESTVLDNGFKDAYDTNLRMLMEQTLNILDPKLSTIKNNFSNSMLLEDIMNLSKSYADFNAEEKQKEQDEVFIPTKINKTLQERIMEHNVMADTNEDDIEVINIGEEIVDDYPDGYDSVPSIYTGLDNNGYKENILQNIADELEPNDKRLIQEKDKICSESLKIKFRRDITKLLESYNTTEVIKQKVVKTINNEVKLAKQEQELYNDIADSTGISSITKKINTNSIGNLTDLPNTNNNNGQNNTVGEENDNNNNLTNNNTNEEDINTIEVQENEIEDNNTEVGTVKENYKPAGGNTVKDGKVETTTNMANGTFNLTESGRHRGMFGEISSKPSSMSIFKEIQYTLFKKNTDILSESSELMDNLFAEAIAYYTLLETLNTVKLYNFNNDKYNLKKIIHQIIQ